MSLRYLNNKTEYGNIWGSCKMIILSKEQVLKLHASLIKATGGSDGICDEGFWIWR